MLRIKIPSGEINNFPLLKKAASYGVEIILSTGMSTLNEIKKSSNKDVDVQSVDVRNESEVKNTISKMLA